MSRSLKTAGALLLPVLLLAAAPKVASAPGTAGVYLRLATIPGGSVDAVVANVLTAATNAGWSILADYDAGVNRQKCAFRAHVMVAHSDEYAKAALQDSKLGAFAAQMRLSVFEDEQGVHVAAVNPRSVNRTVVAETGRDADWAALAGSIETAMRAQFQGTTNEYGQRRAHGRIGKTMGIMAGGPFTGKVETVLTVPLGEQNLGVVAAQLYTHLEKQSGLGPWKLRPVFLHNTGDANVIVVGVTSEAMEAKSFDIVNTGGDSSRGKMRCPGIDHAAAYPVEVVLVKSGDHVAIQIMDEMFRMKLYFEDAGKMAFAKNMGMPGSIEDELKQKIRSAFRPTT